ncbi:alginate biosynthesis protein Alg44 [Thalassobaculum sp. OXR-137]|uniref:alginate biosynthesis protein Alg44 n=1 Tax=Thalassobaculum sp. OXR-137 TaxID=3100173 RepID=UPI002AC9D5C5|nr:alginate biosynthesis protein Alg44 [Thalassobaculum sp. OXR-137]WPZ32343.1 alginate biosynthesis protein Alg44 [Thalassobaculum sp. OXR-137]
MDLGNSTPRPGGRGEGKATSETGVSQRRPVHPSGTRRETPSSAASQSRTGGITSERRDERRHVRVHLPFEVKTEHGTFDGRDLSVTGCAVAGLIPDGVSEPLAVEATVPFRGFLLQLPFTATVSHRSTVDGAPVTGLEIVSMDDQERTLLSRLITAQLSGRLISFDGLLSPSDGQVARRSKAAPGGAADGNGKSGRRTGRVVGIAALMLCATAVAVAAIYDSVFVIESPFAATTAARLDVNAPGKGRFTGVELRPGDVVERDQEIGRVSSADLKAELSLAQATLRYNEQLLSTLNEAVEAGRVDAGSTIDAALSRTDDDTGMSVVDLLSIEKRLEQLDAQTNLQRAKVSALETRQSENVLYSPCDCIVHWAHGGAGEAWVEPGDKVYSLVPRGADEMLVEAQIPMDAVPRLTRSQRANIYSPNTGQNVWGRIVDLSVEGSRRPRAGFPRWVRQDLSKATLLIAPEEPLRGIGVGTPVEVSFSDISSKFDTWEAQAADFWDESVATLSDVSGVDIHALLPWTDKPSGDPTITLGTGEDDALSLARPTETPAGS